MRAFCSVLLVAGALAVAGCEATDRIGAAADLLHGSYCQASAATRDTLRSVMVFDDGSPKVVVHCQPHAEPG